MMRIIDLIARYVVGALFIFSGLIKLNDPIGTKIKMEEYFEVFSSDFAGFFEYFVPWALPIAMIIIVLEIVLGLALFINYKMNITAWVLLLLILFFTFLTFYSAYFDKVTDCGCFGDAIPLTPWESFFKDVVLLILIAHIFWHRKRFQGIIPEKLASYTLSILTVISFLIGWYAIEHLPYIDFRPYKVGNVIQEQMIPDEQPIIEYIFEKDGEEVTSEKYLMEEDGYKYVSSRVVNEDATIPKITDYQVSSPEGEDFTEESLSGLKMVIVFHDQKTLRYNGLNDLSALISQMDGIIETVIFTAISEADFENIRHEYQLAAPYYFIDGTVAKAIIRSNPGILIWNDGKVLGKWHINDIPSESEIAEIL